MRVAVVIVVASRAQQLPASPPPLPPSFPCSAEDEERLFYPGFLELIARLAWRLGGSADYDTAGLGLPPAPREGWPLLARLQALIYRMHSCGARFQGEVGAALVRAAASEVRSFLASVK